MKACRRSWSGWRSPGKGSRYGCRYKLVADNMMVKEVKVEDDDRCVICLNPEQAERDHHVRDDLVARFTEMITGTDTLTVAKRAELHGKISAKPGLNRYLRLTPGELLRIDAAAETGPTDSTVA